MLNGRRCVGFRWGLGLSANGIWHINVSNQKYAKCIDICAANTFKDLTMKVSKAFGIRFHKTNAQFSYWYEGHDTVFT